MTNGISRSGFRCSGFIEYDRQHDRETKFQDYATHGVAKYWIIDPNKETIEQFVLQNDKYELLLKTKDGAIASFVLPEFQIPVCAVFNKKTNLETLGRLLAQQ